MIQHLMTMPGLELHALTIACYVGLYDLFVQNQAKSNVSKQSRILQTVNFSQSLHAVDSGLYSFIA